MRVVIASSWNDKEVSLTHQCKLMLFLNVGFNHFYIRYSLMMELCLTGIKEAMG